jgi:hypothetical protein
MSHTSEPGRYDAVALRAEAWAVAPGIVRSARSSYFEDPASFPPGAAEVDCALVMRRVPVQWDSLPALRTTVS